MGYAGISKEYPISKEVKIPNIPHLSDTLIVTESKDPAEVGDYVIFTAEIVDPHGVFDVQIEIDGWYNSMDQIDSSHWGFNWTAPSPGLYDYTVSYKDGKDRLRTYNDSILVLGDAPPYYWDLKILSNPLELGKNVKISLKITDSSGINQVLIDYEGGNHSVNHLGGDNYEYNDWTPSSLGNYPFQIHMEDNNHKWNFYSDVLQVVLDTTPPKYLLPEDMVETVEIGEEFSICAMITDTQGINQVLIEYEASNHSMDNVGGDSWCYTQWKPTVEGIYPYSIYMQDIYDNWNHTSRVLTVLTPSTSGSADDDREDDNTKEKSANTSFDILLPLLIIAAVGGVAGLVVLTKLKKKPNKREDKHKSKVKKDKFTTYQIKQEKGEIKEVHVVCPICKSDFHIEIPKSVINEAKQLITISIPKDSGCEHHFQAFIDKNFIVRGYQKVDYEFATQNEALKLEPIPERLDDKKEKKIKKKGPVNKALLKVKQELEKEAILGEKDGLDLSQFKDIESIYFQIRQFLSIPDENFDLYKVINQAYESEKARFKIVESILTFINHFAMFKQIEPLMCSLYTYVKQSVEEKSKNIKEFEQVLIKSSLMGFIKEYIHYTDVEQKHKVLDFLTESLSKLKLEPLIVNLGLLLKPMYEDVDYLSKLQAVDKEQVSYLEEEEKENLIKRAIDKWIEEQPLNLDLQAEINENLMLEFNKLAQKYDISHNTEPYKRLFIDVKEMLALKLTVISLMDGIADESFEPIPLK